MFVKNKMSMLEKNWCFICEAGNHTVTFFV